MSKLPIITLPDPLLRQASKPIETIDADVKRLASDMFETMYVAPGIGLAAVQVGVPRQMLVLDVADDDETPRPITMINPQIIESSNEMRTHEEGCLSIPDFKLDIDRPDWVRVTYLDLDGKLQELRTGGLLATAIQHEIDHLRGKLIIDFLSRLKRDIVIRRFKKQSRDAMS
ncbi:MAG: peptide deformylase [Hyphomicrobiaceae bacterium]|jgi:peptide deformylase|nr:peptide deformylase [Hyphomicrobiaceae bacterium]